MHFLSIIRIIGILVMCFSGTMLVPAFVALIYGDGGGKSFMQAFILSLSVGFTLWWSCHHHKQELRSREGFLIVVAFWLVLGGLATLPLLFFDAPHLSIASVIFEAFSGLTTTGATILTGLDNFPKSILFYRQFLQWIGGMGMIVLAVAVIPLLGIGGNHLYRAESSGPMKNQRVLPRIAETAKLLWFIYFVLTVLCSLSFRAAGMTWFDAICHSFSTVSNGGFSTHDSSMSYFNSGTIYGVATLFMLIGGCNFSLHMYVCMQRGEGLFNIYWRDAEFRFFALLQFTFILLFSVGLFFTQGLSWLQSLQQGALQLVSMSMTSGYTLFDINKLHPALAMLLLFAALIGGCAGSTTGGLKAIRVLVLWLQMKLELKRLVHPNLVETVKLNKRSLPPKVIENIGAFLVVFIFVFWLCVFAAMLCGMSITDSIGGVLATLSNAGPGFGITSQNFSQVPDSAKYVFSFAMICGRLEIFSLLVLFTPAFWKS